MANESLDDSAMQERVIQFLASGQNPNGYYVSAETLFHVINGIRDITEATRKQVTEAIKDLIVPGNFIDSFRLGLRFGQLFEEIPDKTGVLAIIKDAKSLDKVPIVKIGDQTVNWF